MVRATIEAKPRIAGVPRCVAPPQIAASLHSSQWRGEWWRPSPAYGCFPSACKRGVQRGAPPSGRRYGGCASITYSSLFPPSFQEGARGMVRATIEAKPQNRGSPAVRSPIYQTVFLLPCPACGESRGAHPLWQAVWRMCLHNLLLFIFPLPGRKGARGMVRAQQWLRLTPHAVRQRAERAGPAPARPRGGGRPDPRLAVARPSGGSRSRCRPYSPPTPGHSGAIRHSRHGR